MITGMAQLLIRLAIIIFAVRICGKLIKNTNFPPVLGDLLAGIIIGPFALGSIRLPGFPDGLFVLQGTADTGLTGGGLYAFAAIGAIIFFFLQGLRTNITLFIKYSIAGSIVSIGGVAASFILGGLITAALMGLMFTSPQSLFMGAVMSVTSAGLISAVLLEKKKMETPEGVTILSAAVFDEIMGIICMLAVLIACRKIDGKITNTGLFLIIAAYIAGLYFSRTKNAAVICSGIYGIYNFFIPILFAIIGMTVNLKIIFSLPVLAITAAITAAAIAAKILGSGAPAFLLGFNLKGSLRIGTGMIPRGEAALIIAGIGSASAILEQNLFTAVVLMVFITNIAAAPIIKASLKLNGKGSQRPVKGDDTINAVWSFSMEQTAGLITDAFLDNLRKEKFYIRTLNYGSNTIQARKNDMALTITENEKTLSITTARTDMPFVKSNIHDIVKNLCESIQKLRESYDWQDSGPVQQTTAELLSLITPDCISVSLKGNNKKEIITELTDLLYKRGKLYNRDQVLDDLFNRERIMSTGMQHGIAMPHAKTEGTGSMAVAVGIKKEGVDFDSVDGSKSRIFIMVISSRKINGPHIQFLSIISGALKDEKLREQLINAATPEEAADILKKN
ncbi:MAG: cation:proton antiporter [Treponema sp.]|nr:cation:proton antiporter [Treponema sp.]